MSRAQTRTFLVDGLMQSGVLGVRTFERRFVQGDGDIMLADLEMDSLARMELCIFIEVNTGLEITPDELDGFATLEGLAAALENSGAAQARRAG